MILNAFLREIVMFYYPKNQGPDIYIYSVLDESIEFERLHAVCKQNFNNSNWIKYLTDLMTAQPFPSAKIFMDERIGVEYKRCFSLKMIINKKELKNNLSEKIWLIINFSILIPFYTIDVVKQTYLIGSLISSAEILPEEEYTQYFEFNRKYIRQSGIQEFPKKFYQERVPEIVFPQIEDGNFTYFNAFFMNSFDDVTAF